MRTHFLGGVCIVVTLICGMSARVGARSVHVGNGGDSALQGGQFAARASDSLDELKDWVRVTFRRVVGRAPSEYAVTEYANQLQAFAERGQLQETKDFLENVVFPTLK